MEPMYSLGITIFTPLAMIALISVLFPGLHLAFRVVIAVLVASIGVRCISVIDGLGRLPQDFASAGIRIDESNADEIGTEHYCFFDLLAIYAAVGVVTGLILALI